MRDLCFCRDLAAFRMCIYIRMPEKEGGWNV